MTVERRRAIAIIVVLLLGAAGFGATLIERDGPAEETVTPALVRAEPEPAPATLPQVAVPAQEEAAVEEDPIEETAGDDAAADEPVLAQPVEEPVAPEAEETRIAAVEPAQPVTEVVPEPAPEPISEPAPLPDAVFDIVRVEPDGSAVIAGRAGPGDTVELLRNGARHDVVVADATGAFAFVPPPLPPGASEIALRVAGADGASRRSSQSVTVAVDENLVRRPMVALVAPDAPTRILSQPEPEEPAQAPAEAQAPADETRLAGVEPAAVEEPVAEAPVVDEPVAEASATEPATVVARADPTAPLESPRRGVRIASVEAETGGGLYVSAEGAPTASVRLYLNETFVARASADPDGGVSFAIRSGVRPGLYRVRVDDVDALDGEVLSRAEVTFEMPALTADLPEEPPVAEAQADVAQAPEAPADAVAEGDAVAEAPAADAEAPAADAEAPAVLPEPEPAREATVVVPEVNTALVVRGDSLWRISTRVYGAGIRYTVIFDANQEQIRNPDLIFPGQVFVLPAAPDEDADAGDGATR